MQVSFDRFLATKNPTSKEITKLAAKYSENARIAARNVRRDILDVLKKLEKSKEMSEDDLRRESDLVQKELDNTIAKIDQMLKDKEKDIMTI